jgi:hypothetical protein
MACSSRRPAKRQIGLAPDPLARGHRRQRTGGRDPQGRHRLTDDVLAQHGAESGTAISVAGERCGARTLELDIPTHTIPIDHLPKKNRPTIAELGHPVPKLKAGVRHGQRLRAFRHSIPSQDLDALGRGQSLGAESQLNSEALVETDQSRRGHWGRRQPRKETLGKSRVAVVEREQGVLGCRSRHESGRRL